MCFGMFQSFISIKIFLCTLCYLFVILFNMVKPSDSFLYIRKISSLSNMSTLILNSHETHNRDFWSSNTLYQNLLPFQTSKGQHLMVAHLGLWFVYVFIEHTALFLNISYQHPNRLFVFQPVQIGPILIYSFPNFPCYCYLKCFIMLLDINKQTRMLFMLCHFGKMF